MAGHTQRHDGEPAFACLKANVGSIQVKSERGIKRHPAVAPDDQQQLVERRDPRRQFGTVAELPAPIDDPADALGPERLGKIVVRDDLTDAVNARDADRPEPSLSSRIC